MNLTALSLEQLETMHGALGEYLGARRRHEAARRLEALEAQRRQVALELNEARAQLAAQKEMSGRLMAALKLTASSTNGHAKPAEAVEVDAPPAIGHTKPAGAVEVDTPPKKPAVSEPAQEIEMDAPPASALTWAAEVDTPPASVAEQSAVSEPAWGDEMDTPPVVSKPAGRKRKPATGNADRPLAGDEPVPAADLPADSLDGTLTLADLAALEDEW